MRTRTQTRSKLWRHVYVRIYVFARLWVRLSVLLAGGVLLAIVLIILGLSSPSSSVPLVSFVHRFPSSSLVIGILLIGLTVGSLGMLGTIHPKRKNGQQQDSSEDDDNGSDQQGDWHLPRLVIAIGMSTLSTTLFFALLLTVIIRPVWCPAALCPAPKIVTQQHSINDGTLEMYETVIESTWYVIPGAPNSYTANSLPEGIGALRMGASPSTPYKVIIGVHSLQQGRIGLIIEQVAIVVAQLRTTPVPLNVWLAGSSLNYNSNPFLVTYRGEGVGATQPAVYIPQPLSHVQLNPGEADNLDIQIVSSVPVDLQFQIQVTYRVGNEQEEHTLTLPQRFEVIFANAANTNDANWHPYQLESGQLVPSH